MQVHLARGTMCACGHPQEQHVQAHGVCRARVHRKITGLWEYIHNGEPCGCQAYTLPPGLAELFQHIANLVAQGWEPEVSKRAEELCKTVKPRPRRWRKPKP